MRYIFITILVWNVITFAMMGLDKYFAIKKKRRISEATLIGCAFALGGIGSTAGMFVFHHKTKHLKFLILLPLSVVINVIAFVGLWTIFSPR